MVSLSVRARRSEFDVTSSAAGFSARTTVTDCEARQLVIAPDQNRLAQILMAHSFNFTGEIQSRINRVSQLVTSFQGLGAVRPGLGKCRPAARPLFAFHRFRHQHRQKPRPETEPLIKTHVLLAL